MTVTERQGPTPTMIEEGQEGCGGRTEERIPASGVVWKETPESAIPLGADRRRPPHGAEGLRQCSLEQYLVHT